jgi:protein gp37
MSTKIEWTDETWNPLVGCSRCSPGCDHCYAIGVVGRNMSAQHRGLTIRSNGRQDWTGEVREVPHLLDQPLHWRKPRRIFVNSLSDLFHPDVTEDFILSVFEVMARCPQHTFQILTKRPQRMAEFTGRLCWTSSDMSTASPYLEPEGSEGEEPLDNVWLGVSIESNRYAFRADHLRASTAAVRWVSAEPLLGPIDALDLTGVDWVVAGGESGPNARPPHPAWFRDLRDRCVAIDCPFLFKQWGEWAPAGNMYDTSDRTHLVMLDGRDRGRPWSGWKIDQPAAEPMRRFGKKVAGRELDGLTWDKYPSGRVGVAGMEPML